MDNFEIGTQHVIWVNPFCNDITAEVVSYNDEGDPIVRTLNKEKLTLEPHEYVFPSDEDRDGLEAVARYFKEVYGEDI